MTKFRGGGSLAFQIKALAFLFITSHADASIAADIHTDSGAVIRSTKAEPPFIHGRSFINGVILSNADVGIEEQDVLGCCSSEENSSNDCLVDGTCETDARKPPNSNPAVIGVMGQLSENQSREALESAKRAWNGGSGTWTQMSLNSRIEAVEKFMVEITKRREEMVQILMWEIGKNRPDAESEFDRTVSFVKETIEEIRSQSSSGWSNVGNTKAFIRRAAIGIIMCLGPYNYPLNETYAALIPALLMGNIIILKVPTVGGLVHILTMDAFVSSLPPGTINFISGRGRVTMPPLMATGSIDGLAFIGGANAADNLIKSHPNPHRLKLFLQLEGKNMAILLPDVFEEDNAAHLDKTIKEVLLGSLSFNGQRCTALKQIFVPQKYAKLFAEKLSVAAEALRVGLPWQTWEGADGKPLFSQITPLPNQSRISYMKRLINDAKSKGANIINKNGGSIVGGVNSTLMVPAILYPVSETMDVYHEEQFGPVVPIAPYDDIETVIAYGRDGKYGMQCSIFTTKGEGDAAALVDLFSAVFGKININSQCGRSPDSLPFSGRRSSAMGTMSISEAINSFSTQTVVAYKPSENDVTDQVASVIYSKTNFMQDVA